MNARQTTKAWTKSEKILLAVILVVTLGGIGSGLLWSAINANPKVTVPTPTMPTPNAFDYFVAAGRSVVDGDKIGFAIASPHPGSATPSDHSYSVGEKAALVAKNAAALRILRQGLSYSYEAPPVRSFSALLPYYAPDRGLARLLLLDAQAKSTQGNHSGAIAAGLDAVQEGEMLPHGSAIIGMLVGIACQAIGWRQAWPEVGHLNAPQSEAAARRLERINALHVPYANVLQEEKWETQAGMMELFRSPDWAKSFFAVGGEDDTQGQNLALRMRLMLTPKRTIMHNYTAYMNRSIANARHCYAAKLPPPPLPTDPFDAILLPTFSLAGFRDAEAEAQDTLLMTVLALRAYRLEHGLCPPTLNALVPAYLSRVPDDPFALAGPLRYKPAGKSYVLYSVGPDGRDDGGKPIFDPTKPAPRAGERDQRYFTQPDSKGDIVAGVNQI